MTIFLEKAQKFLNSLLIGLLIKSPYKDKA